MSLRKSKTAKTYYAVGVRSDLGGVFHDVVLPNGDRVRIMDRDVFDRAVAAADAKLRNTTAIEGSPKPKK